MDVNCLVVALSRGSSFVPPILRHRWLPRPRGIAREYAGGCVDFRASRIITIIMMFYEIALGESIAP